LVAHSARNSVSSLQSRAAEECLISSRMRQRHSYLLFALLLAISVVAKGLAVPAAAVFRSADVRLVPVRRSRRRARSPSAALAQGLEGTGPHLLVDESSATRELAFPVLQPGRREAIRDLPDALVVPDRQSAVPVHEPSRQPEIRDAGRPSGGCRRGIQRRASPSAADAVRHSLFH